MRITVCYDICNESSYLHDIPSFLIYTMTILVRMKKKYFFFFLRQGGLVVIQALQLEFSLEPTLDSQVQELQVCATMPKLTNALKEILKSARVAHGYKPTT